jgi:50S ribosome-binding GTPase/Type II intron maturase
MMHTAGSSTNVFRRCNFRRQSSLWYSFQSQHFVTSATGGSRFTSRRYVLKSKYITQTQVPCSKPHCQQQKRFMARSTVKAPVQRSRDDEEYHSGRALRFLQQNQPNVIVQVENAQLSAVKLLPRIADATIQSTPLRIKVLTHVDTISDEALRQQIHTVQQIDERVRLPNQSPLAVFALNLQTVQIQAKELSEFRDALFGASRLVTKPQILVVGIPNSGKSSLILPLTRHRTLMERKKGAYHLPRVSSKAGMTLGVKKHLLPPAFGSFIKHNITLIDMPGFRPQLQYAEPALVTLLLSAGVTEPFQGYKTITSHEAILELLLNAANRHATMSDPSSAPEYVDLLKLSQPTNDTEVFANAYMKWARTASRDELEDISGHNSNPATIYWPRVFQSGIFGGLIFTPYPTLPNSSHSSHIELNRDSPVVYMNEQAELLIRIGLGKEKAIKIHERAKLGPTSLNRDNDIVLDPNRKLIPVIYPPHQRSFKCMQCAHFIKLDADKVYGRRHTRAVDWSYHDLLSYFSRMTEVFGGMFSNRTKYLMKDSLACTLAIKHKLRSRAAAYKKFNGLKDYPVPNHLRPRRFQIDQPIPYVHFCTRKVGSCRTMTEAEKQKEIAKLERCNVTDHTFELQRARGAPVNRAKRKEPREVKLRPDGSPVKPPTFVARECIVTTVGPLSAVPRYDSKGNELHTKRRRKAKD